ncbi:unnamed protein product, partial [marine sediment metagenome]
SNLELSLNKFINRKEICVMKLASILPSARYNWRYSFWCQPYDRRLPSSHQIILRQ